MHSTDGAVEWETAKTAAIRAQSVSFTEFFGQFGELAHKQGPRICFQRFFSRKVAFFDNGSHCQSQRNATFRTSSSNYNSLVTNHAAPLQGLTGNEKAESLFHFSRAKSPLARLLQKCSTFMNFGSDGRFSGHRRAKTGPEPYQSSNQQTPLSQETATSKQRLRRLSVRPRARKHRLYDLISFLPFKFLFCNQIALFLSFIYFIRYPRTILYNS